jgi:hypothetical protein
MMGMNPCNWKSHLLIVTESFTVLPRVRTVLRKNVRTRGKTVNDSVTKPLVVWATSHPQPFCRSTPVGLRRLQRPVPGSHLPALRKALPEFETRSNGFVTESFTVLPRVRTVLRKNVRTRGKTVNDSVTDRTLSFREIFKCCLAYHT